MVSHLGCLLIFAALCPHTGFPAALRHDRSGALLIDFENGLYPFSPEEWNGGVAWKVHSYESLDEEMNGTAPRPDSGGEMFAKLDLAAGISSGSFIKSPWFRAVNGAKISFDYYLRSSLDGACGIEVAYLEKDAEYQSLMMSLYDSSPGNKEFVTATAEIPAGISAPIQVWIYGSGNFGKVSDIIAIDNFIMEGNIRFLDDKLNTEFFGESEKTEGTNEFDFTTEKYKEKITEGEVELSTGTEGYETTEAKPEETTESKISTETEGEETSRAVNVTTEPEGADESDFTTEKYLKETTEGELVTETGIWETTSEVMSTGIKRYETSEAEPEETTNGEVFTETREGKETTWGDVTTEHFTEGNQTNPTTENPTSLDPESGEDSSSEEDKPSIKVSVHTIVKIVYPNGREEVSVSHDHIQGNRHGHSEEDEDFILDTMARSHSNRRANDNLKRLH